MRARIVAAARASFIARGFAGTTLELIADEAGTTWRSVASRFPDRHALLLAVAETNCAFLADEVLRRPEDNPLDDDLAHFRSVCRRLLDSAIDESASALTRVMFGEVAHCPALGALIVDYNSRTQKSIEEIIVRAQHNGRFQRYRATAVAVAAIGIMLTTPLTRAILQDPMFSDPHEIDLYFSEGWTVFLSMS